MGHFSEYEGCLRGSQRRSRGDPSAVMRAQRILLFFGGEIIRCPYKKSFLTFAWIDMAIYNPKCILNIRIHYFITSAFIIYH